MRKRGTDNNANRAQMAKNKPIVSIGSTHLRGIPDFLSTMTFGEYYKKGDFFPYGEESFLDLCQTRPRYGTAQGISKKYSAVYG